MTSTKGHLGVIDQVIAKSDIRQDSSWFENCQVVDFQKMVTVSTHFDEFPMTVDTVILG